MGWMEYTIKYQSFVIYCQFSSNKLLQINNKNIWIILAENLQEKQTMHDIVMIETHQGMWQLFLQSIVHDFNQNSSVKKSDHS